MHLLVLSAFRPFVEVASPDVFVVVSMHLLVLSAFRLPCCRNRTSTLTGVSMHLLVLSAFRLMINVVNTIQMDLSQCTFWCSVLSDFGTASSIYLRGGEVSMHLLVLDDYRLTSPQAAPQRRLFDGNRHGRFTRPDSSANTMSIRPCSRRIPPLNGHASPTVQAPLSAPVFTGPRRQASCCRNFPSIRACTVAPSQIISKRAHPRFPRIEAKSIHRNTQHHKASVQQPHTQSSRRRTTAFPIPPSLNLVRVSWMLDGFRLRVQQRSSPCRHRELAATERGAYATDATADFGSVCRGGHPKHRPKQRRHGELAHKSGKELQITNRKGSQAKDAGFPVSDRRRTTRPTALSA